MTQNKAVIHKAPISTWATPWDVFFAINEQFAFTLDVAADEHNKKCLKFYSQEQDALTQPWAPHICWMNPPYDKWTMTNWLHKAAQEAQKGAEVVALLPANVGTAWFTLHVIQAKRPVLHWPKRIRFIDPTGKNRSAPANGNMLVYFGRKYRELKPIKGIHWYVAEKGESK